MGEAADSPTVSQQSQIAAIQADELLQQGVLRFDQSYECRTQNLRLFIGDLHQLLVDIGFDVSESARALRQTDIANAGLGDLSLTKT